MYKNWINAILGIVIIGVAFMEVSASTLTWILAITGAIVAIDSFWSIVASDDVGTHQFTKQT